MLSLELRAGCLLYQLADRARYGREREYNVDYLLFWRTSLSVLSKAYLILRQTFFKKRLGALFPARDLVLQRAAP